VRNAYAVLYVAGALTPTNVSLLEAAREIGLDAALLPIEDVAGRARPGDLVLPRLDVLPTLDGIEPGLWLLDRCERNGATIVNGSGAVLAAHDKLATALRLARTDVPHPRTRNVDGSFDGVGIEFPVVVKPRFGSWGRDVFRCASRHELLECLEELADRAWFARQGALVQELVPPRGFDLRIVVAGGTVVGAVRRVAAAGEWRTNVALGGRREPTFPPAAARASALAAAEAVGAGLVGVDLLPTDDGWTVVELNACVDFTREYGFLGRDPFVEAILAVHSIGVGRAVALLPV
jgi:RimK family alpha-L-glutamate ligase